MNRIYSPLGQPESVDINGMGICWELRKDTEVPEVTAPMDLEAKGVWNTYLELLFDKFHLLRRLGKYQDEIKMSAGSFYQRMYPKDEVNKRQLLELLMHHPREFSAWRAVIPEVENDVIAKVSNYKYLTSGYHNEFARLMEMLGVKTCPYCGRTFTTTVGSRRGRFVRTGQVDHFFPKSKYPWLALSIWNLVPVCGYCNHRKLDDDEAILYPYEEGMGCVYRFRTHPTRGVGYLVGTQGSEDEFAIRLEAMDPKVDATEFGSRARNEMNRLHLEELYSSHRGYVSEIFRQRYVFGPPYIDALVSSFPDLFHSRGDVLAMLSLKRVDMESVGRMPLDKLTRDVHLEIDELTGERFVQ